MHQLISLNHKILEKERKKIQKEDQPKNPNLKTAKMMKGPPILPKDGINVQGPAHTDTLQR
jgi:hypothetical protein